MQDGQGRVCQIAMILSDSKGNTLGEIASLVKPHDWQIQSGAQKVHGHTDKKCEDFGLIQAGMVSAFIHFINMATIVVAHNEEFDREMMNVELAYSDVVGKGDAVKRLQSPWICTMKKNKHIANGRWPKLDATLKHYCNREIMNAHDAMADTRACRDIFFAMHGIQIKY